MLSDTGAFLTWKPGERFVLITTSVPTVVSFAIGDRRYDLGPISLQASFAPFLVGDEAYLPLREVLRALDLALHEENGEAVLQPQLAALDVRQEASRVTVFAHGGATLHARVVQESPASITYAFDGVGTSLSGTRQVGTGGIGSITIANSRNRSRTDNPGDRAVATGNDCRGASEHRRPRRPTRVRRSGGH